MTITVTKRHLWIFVKYGLLVSFFGCVVLCEGVSIPLPNAAQYKDQFPLGALAPYRSSWQYILVSTGIQVLHQRPSFPLHIGAIATLSNAAFIVTLSGVLWTGGVGAAFYPRAWSLTENNLQAHIDLSLFIAGITLLQLAKTIRPEAIPGEMPSSFILAKGLVGVPLFLLAVSVLGSRCRHRVMAGYTSWKEELLLLCPFLLGTLIFLAFLAEMCIRDRKILSLRVPAEELSLPVYLPKGETAVSLPSHIGNIGIESALHGNGAGFRALLPYQIRSSGLLIDYDHQRVSLFPGHHLRPEEKSASHSSLQQQTALLTFTEFIDPVGLLPFIQKNPGSNQPIFG